MSGAASAGLYEDRRVKAILQQHEDGFGFQYCTDELWLVKEGKQKEVTMAWTQLAVYVLKRKARTLLHRIPFLKIERLVLPGNATNNFQIHWDGREETFFAADHKHLVTAFQQLKVAHAATKERDHPRHFAAPEDARGKGKGSAAKNGDTAGEPHEARQESQDALQLSRPILLSCLVDSEYIDYGALRAVYERRQDGEMRAHLSDYIKEQRASLERLCAAHYEGFLGSMAEIGDLSCRAVDIPEALKARAVGLSGHVQGIAAELHARATRVKHLRATRDNIEGAIAVVRTCRELAKLDAKAMALIEQQQYYPALVVIEQLQGILYTLNPCEYVNYLLLERVPAMQQTILVAVKRSFNDWLAHVRALSEAIGRRAMEQAQGRLRKKVRGILRQTRVKTRRASGLLGHESDDSEGEQSEAARRRAQEEEEEAEQEALFHSTAGNAKALLKDFDIILGRPHAKGQAAAEAGAEPGLSLNSCQRIYEQLGRGDEFRNYFMLQHKKQLDQELDAMAKVDAAEWGRDVLTWYSRLVGFFIVEDIIRNATSPSLSSDLHICTLWEHTMRAVVRPLERHLQSTPSLDAFLHVSERSMEFVTSIQESCRYNLDLSPLVLCIEGIRRQFDGVLVDDSWRGIRDILAREDYAAFRLPGPEEWAAEVEAWGLQEMESVTCTSNDPGAFSVLMQNALHSQTLPSPKAAAASSGTSPGAVADAPPDAACKFSVAKLVRFTSTVPKVLEVIAKYIDNSFIIGRHLSNADDDIQNGVEVLVQQTVHHLETRMKKLGRNNVVQIARLCANAAALCGALPALEHRFATLSSRRILNTTILQDGRARFGDLVAFGEGLVTATFAQKVAEYTDMLSPSLWAPYTKAHSPYNFMAYLVQYLHSAFSELDTILSPEHARRLKTDGFQHIAKVCMGLLQTMLTPPTASGEAVANFKKDMQLVRQFAAAQGDEFVGCFEALAQRLEGVLDEVVPATAAQQPRARASGERKRRRHQWLMPWRTVGSHP